MGDTKALIRERLRLAGSVLPTPNAPATNGHANPLGLSAQSEYLQTIKRPDASTVASPGGFYGGHGGNQIAGSELETIATLGATSRPSATSPAGAPIPGGLGS